MLDFSTSVERESRERYQARLDERATDRLVRSVQAEQPSLHHRLAQWSGRALVGLGASLLRYGRAAEETGVAHVSA